MSIFDELISNRSSADACYNVSDLNRVTQAVSVLSQELRGFGYYVDPKYKVPAEWVVEDIPTAQEMSKYLGNVKSIRRQMSRNDLPLPNGMDGLTYYGANDIEATLKIINDSLPIMQGHFRRCNTFRCGERR